MRSLLRRVWYLLGRQQHERELAEEVATHRALAEEALGRAGAAPSDARQVAHRQMGNVTLASEEAHDVWAMTTLDHVITDVRLGLRTMAARRLLTASAVLSIGVGVGLNIGLYSVLQAMLLQPFLTTDAPNRVAWVTEGASFPDYVDMRAASASVDLAAMQMTGLAWTDDGVSKSVSGHVVSRNFFEVLGVQPVLGRGFVASVDPSHGPDEVVLSFGFWQRQFGEDPTTVGRTMILNGRPYRVVGVLPRGFSSMALATPQVYVPVGEFVTTALADRNPAQFDLLARVPAGMSRARGTAALRVAAEAVEASVPRTHVGWARRLTLEEPTGLMLFGGMFSRGIILGFGGVLFVLTGLVLLIACANVAGLLVAKADERRRDVSVRIALGATRARIAQQYLVETLLLALAGCVAGILAWGLCADLASRALVDVGAHVTVFSSTIPLVFAAVLALVVTLACGVLPAYTASEAAPIDVLRRANTTHASRSLTFQRALVAVQVAVSVVLLTAPGALADAFVRTRATDPGFDVAHTLSVDIRATGFRLPRYEELRETMAALPGVEAVTAAQLNFWFPPIRQALRRVDPAGDAIVPADVAAVKSHYLETMRIPLQRGRDLTDDDLRESDAPERSALVNESFARQYLRDEDLDVARFVVPPDAENGIPARTVRIVGVAHDTLGRFGVPTVFIPTAALGTFVVRVAGPSENALKMVQAAVTRRVPGAAVSVAPVQIQVARALLPARVGMFGLSAIGALALLLGMVGLHGSVRYAASQRTFEIGVRTALGATRRSILQLVLRDGAMPVGLGGLAGAALSIPALYTLRPFLAVGQYVMDPPVLLAVFTVLLLTTTAATLSPAWRAARVDPMTALRTD